MEVNMGAELKLTLNVSGEGFSPDDFNESLPIEVRGKVKTTRSVADIPPKNYWFYESEVPDGVEAEQLLCELVHSYGDHLMKFDNLTKYASIVGKFKSTSDIRGFFISKELIKACDEKGFEVDIDLYDS